MNLALFKQLVSTQTEDGGPSEHGGTVRGRCNAAGFRGGVGSKRVLINTSGYALRSGKSRSKDARHTRRSKRLANPQQDV